MNLEPLGDIGHHNPKFDINNNTHNKLRFEDDMEQQKFRAKMTELLKSEREGAHEYKPWQNDVRCLAHQLDGFLEYVEYEGRKIQPKRLPDTVRIKYGACYML